MTNRTKLWISYGLICVSAAIIYVPYVMHGGFQQDDWGVIRLARDNPGFWATYKAWFPLFSNRPLAPMVLSMETTLFGDAAPLHILFNLVLWFLSIALVCIALRRHYGYLFTVLFVLLCSAPGLSPGILFSPSIQTPGTGAFFFWSLSLLLLMRSLERKRYSLLPYVLLVASLLTYEVWLPLFVLTMAIPFLMSPTDGATQQSLMGRVIRYVLPLIVVLAMVAVYQKIVMPAFMPVYSRLQVSMARGPTRMLSWLFAFGPGQLLLWADAVRENLGHASILVYSALAASIGLLGYWFASHVEQGPVPTADVVKANRGKIILAMVASLLSCSFLFLLSGKGAWFSGGYSTCVMSSSWVALSLLLAFVCATSTSRWARISICLVVVLATCTFMVQRENHIRAWALQNEVLDEFVSAMSEAKVPAGSVVVGDVPRIVGGNYNYAQVFNFWWDWGSAIYLRSGGKAVSGAVIGRDQPKWRCPFRQGEELVISDQRKAPIADVWVFSYSPKTGKGTMRKVTDAKDWDQLLVEVQQRNLNPRNDPIEERLAKMLSGAR